MKFSKNELIFIYNCVDDIFNKIPIDTYHDCDEFKIKTGLTVEEVDDLLKSISIEIDFDYFNLNNYFKNQGLNTI